MERPEPVASDAVQFDYDGCGFAPKSLGLLSFFLVFECKCWGLGVRLPSKCLRCRCAGFLVQVCLYQGTWFRFACVAGCSPNGHR